ncbi:hypothetical protein [Nocardioides bruguierae]|uniref:hypothetical protein n=1 Tax=Nocardioides bruguierae TaxID=2945102 RepID=UPI00201FD151|nr:hypothetical protein [Nocardioides bruguierae]MCL8027583.1 hypothetical protein [Nocardioides bruguierae]
MPDQLTSDAADTPPPVPSPAPVGETSRGRRPARRSLTVAGLVVLVPALLGPLLGWLWESVWTPTQGVVVQGTWYVVDSDLTYDLDGLRNQFSGPALYAVITLAAGLLVGVVAGLLARRDEVLTLVAVLVGSTLCGLLAWQTGTRLGPADPQVLAASADDGTRLPDHLTIGSWAVLTCAPLAAAIALVVVFGLLPRTSRRRPQGTPDAG